MGANSKPCKVTISTGTGGLLARVGGGMRDAWGYEDASQGQGVQVWTSRSFPFSQFSELPQLPFTPSSRWGDGRPHRPSCDIVLSEVKCTPVWSVYDILTYKSMNIGQTIFLLTGMASEWMKSGILGLSRSLWH
jgi:hypothetical protein